MSSFSFQNKEIVSSLNNNLLFCPSCKLIPKILINELTEEITYICSHSSNKMKKTYSLNYFNKDINIIDKNIIDINTKCLLHNKKFIYYCNSCKINLCPDCKNLNKDEIKMNHLEHDIIELKIISPTGSNINKKKRILESFKKNLNKANLIFEEYISEIKLLWKKIYSRHNNLIEYKQKIIETYINIENNYNSINNLNQILNEIKFINKPFDFLNEVILNKSVTNIIKKIENIFEIKNYGQSNVDEMNIQEIFEENRNNTLNSSTSKQKSYAIIKTMINIKIEEKNNYSKLLKEYLICGLSSGILKIYDTNPKFNFKKNIYLNYSKDKFIDNKEINYMTEIYKENNNLIKNNKNVFYLLICSSDLEIIEISNNFESYSFIQKIGEPNSIYDKALFICNNNMNYILANSSWLSFLNLYKINSFNSSQLINKINDSDESYVSFIESIKGENFFEILCTNYVEDDDIFYLIFYRIYNNNKIENKKMKVSSFINEQDCLFKFNEFMAGLILGNYFNLDYENNSENKINDNNRYINGILLIDLINKQIISTIESPYYISKIFPIFGGLFVYYSKIKKIRLLKYENMKDKYPDIILNKNKFYFNSDNLEFCYEDINDNKYGDNNINENYIEDEPIFLLELNGGSIALAKNQRIKLFK